MSGGASSSRSGLLSCLPGARPNRSSDDRSLMATHRRHCCPYIRHQTSVLATCHLAQQDLATSRTKTPKGMCSRLKDTVCGEDQPPSADSRRYPPPPCMSEINGLLAAAADRSAARPLAAPPPSQPRGLHSRYFSPPPPLPKLRGHQSDFYVVSQERSSSTVLPSLHRIRLRERKRVVLREGSLCSADSWGQSWRDPGRILMAAACVQAQPFCHFRLAVA